VDYEELRQVVIEMRINMGDSCAPLYWPYGPGDDYHPSPPPALHASVLDFLYLNVQMFKFVINIYNILF
jgi:hypothetical protein